MSAVTTLNGVKMIALAYHEKSDNGKKEKANKSNFLFYFLATECVTTLTGMHAERNGHYPDGKISPSKFIKGCKFLEEYSDGMPASDTVNRYAQFLLRI